MNETYNIELAHFHNFYESIEAIDTSFLKQTHAMYKNKNLSYDKSFVGELNSITQIKLINSSIEMLKDSMVDVSSLEKFFSNTYKYPKLADMQITTTVYDENLYDKIRPHFLITISNDANNAVSDLMSAKLSEDDIKKKYLSKDKEIYYKSNTIKTSHDRYTADVKNLYTYDNRVNTLINSEYITNNILYFLRNINSEYNDILRVSETIKDNIATASANIKISVSVARKMFDDGRIDKKMLYKAEKVLFKFEKLIIKVSSFMTYMFIKKINSINLNIKMYQDLKFKIINNFPEAELILHESVLDGKIDDIDRVDIIDSVLKNNVSLFRAIISTRVNKLKTDIEFAYTNNRNFVNDILNEYMDKEYNDSPYIKCRKLFSKLSTIPDVIREKLKLQNVDSDDINPDDIQLIPFELSVVDKIIYDLGDTSYYDNLYSNIYEPMEKVELFGMMFHELIDSEQYIETIVDSIYKAYKEYNLLYEELEVPDNTIYPNEDIVKNTRKKIIEFNPEYKQLVMTTMNNLIKRVSNITDILEDIGNEMFKNQDIESFGEQMLEYSDDDMYFDHIGTLIDVYESVDSVIYSNMIKDISKAKYMNETGIKLVYEADENTDNTTTNTTTKVSTNTPKNTRDAIAEIRKRIGVFFTKITDALQSILNKQAKNTVAWIEKNEKSLLEKNYSDTNVSVIPYEKYVTFSMISGDFDKFNKNVNALATKGVSGVTEFSSKEDMIKNLCNFVEGIDKMTEDFSANLTKYYKVKNNALKAVNYNGDGIKTLLPIMINYCKNFNSDSGAESLTALIEDTNALNSEVEKIAKIFEASNVNESVMYEAEEATTNVTTTTTKTDNKKPDTKPSITSKSTGEEVKGKNISSSNSGNSNLTKIKWLSSITQTFTASIVGAARDRNYDYIKILKALAGVSGNTETNQEDNNNE